MTFDEIIDLWFFLMALILLLAIATLIGGVVYFLKAQEHYNKVRRRLGFLRDDKGRPFRERERL